MCVCADVSDTFPVHLLSRAAAPFKAPKIEQHPKSVEVSAVGEEISFSVHVSENTYPAPLYQWYRKSPTHDDWELLKEQTSFQLKWTVANQNSTALEFRCLVKNEAGSVHSKSVKIRMGEYLSCDNDLHH